MSEYVVINAEGQFLSFGLTWCSEYPDALVYTSKATACTAARRSKALCEVVEDYGLATQYTVETVG